MLSPRGGSGWGWSGTVMAPPHPSHVTQTWPASMPVSNPPHPRCSSKKATRLPVSV